MIYLDANATFPPRTEALAAMQAALAETGNASSAHAAGRAARARVDAARAEIAAANGVAAAEIVFTSGATEANALALRAKAACVLVSAIEHDSVLKNAGGEFLPVDANGVVKLDELEKLLAKAVAPALVSVMAVNNETGVIQPIAEVLRLVRAAGGFLHVDAVQALGRLPLFWAEADLISLSAHKIGGPQGVGALIVKPSVALEPLWRGGGQEHGVRAGTENVAGIVGFAAAAREASREIGAFQKLAVWRDAMERELGVEVAGKDAPRVANTSCLIHPRLSAEVALMKLDLAGFAVSSGSACSSGRVKASHVLAAMGMAKKAQESAIRVSLSPKTQENEVKSLVACWTQL